MSPVVLALPGNEGRGRALAGLLGAEAGTLTMRRFPDGESYVRIDSAVAGRVVVLVCTLDRPDEKLVRLWLAAAAARDLGAAAVGLVAAYLPYMRQDDRFAPGEAVASRAIGRLLSSAVDWLITVDPHLHRHASLAEVYSVPAIALHAAPLIASWIAAHVRDAVLVGPDRESAQWAAAVAQPAGLPCMILEKVRHGDRDVEVTVAGAEQWRGRTPVLVDDVVSTGRTLLAAIAHLRRAGLRPAVCIGVHAVFAAGAYEELLAGGAARVVTSNTISHVSNAIDVDGLLAEGVRAAQASAGEAPPA